MLSGIGPAEELRQHGIPVRVDLPGVGKNLQDRYEIGVVNRMNFEEWQVFDGAKFCKGDPQYQTWNQARDGAYTTNGTVLSLFKRSAPDRSLPDLFCLAVLGRFEGYFPGYSEVFATNRNYLTWAVLKAHTNNRAGELTLRSANPLDMPEINFRYFGDGTEDDEAREDLESLVAGVRFVQQMARFNRLVTRVCALQGDGALDLGGDVGDAQLGDVIRREAWGHGCGVCPACTLRKRGYLAWREGRKVV